MFWGTSADKAGGLETWRSGAVAKGASRLAVRGKPGAAQDALERQLTVGLRASNGAEVPYPAVPAFHGYLDVIMCAVRKELLAPLASPPPVFAITTPSDEGGRRVYPDEAKAEDSAYFLSLVERGRGPAGGGGGGGSVPTLLQASRTAYARTDETVVYPFDRRPPPSSVTANAKNVGRDEVANNPAAMVAALLAKPPVQATHAASVQAALQDVR